jgi:hypothetical protein
VLIVTNIFDGMVPETRRTGGYTTCLCIIRYFKPEAPFEHTAFVLFKREDASLRIFAVRSHFNEVIEVSASDKAELIERARKHQAAYLFPNKVEYSEP